MELQSALESWSLPACRLDVEREPYLLAMLITLSRPGLITTLSAP
jgi:hypothetical protein